MPDLFHAEGPSNELLESRLRPTLGEKLAELVAADEAFQNALATSESDTSLGAKEAPNFWRPREPSFIDRFHPVHHCRITVPRGLARDIDGYGSHLRILKAYLAIRDDDCDLLARLAQGAISTGGIGTASYLLGGQHVAPATVAAAIVSAFLFFRSVFKKVVKLEGIQFEILRGLKSRSDGMSESEIEGWLKWAGHSCSGDEVHSHLLRLTAVRLNDGTVKPIVNQAADGRWSAAGV